MSLPMKWWISQSGFPHQRSKSLAGALAPVPGRAHVADRRVEPDVEVVARRVGDLEAEVGRRPRDVPVAQRLGEEAVREPVGGLAGHPAGRLRPLGEEVVEALEHDEVMRRRAQLGARAGDRADRIGELLRSVDRAADLAVVAVLIGRAAARAAALHEAIGQEDPAFASKSWRPRAPSRARPRAARPTPRSPGAGSTGCGCCRSGRTGRRSRRDRARARAALLRAAPRARGPPSRRGSSSRCRGCRRRRSCAPRDRASAGSAPRCWSGRARPGDRGGGRCSRTEARW